MGGFFYVYGNIFACYCDCEIVFAMRNTEVIVPYRHNFAVFVAGEFFVVYWCFGGF